MKKSICMVSDVKGWGGWVRGEYIIKHLSDEFEILLVDQNELKDIVNDFANYFDLYYFLFHTMLVKKSVKNLFDQGAMIATIVTGFPTVKPCFKRSQFGFVHLAKVCKAIFANNYISLDDLEKEKPLGMPIYYCPRGVDENVFYPTGNKDKKFTVVYVGKPEPQKGLEEFIKPACKKAGVNLIINDRNFTTAMGPDEMRDLYNRADCLLVASTIDGTPNPALEAMACGLPVIGNYIGNLPVLIDRGVNGFMMQERDVNKYADFLKILKNDRELCGKMGKNARDTILKGWTWEKVLENERMAFREILKNGI